MIKGCETGKKKQLNEEQIEKLTKFMLCMNYAERRVALYTVEEIDMDLARAVTKNVEESKPEYNSNFQVHREYMRNHYET